MTEVDLIRRLTASLPRSPAQRNAPFECDAELVDLAGQLWALSLDEFSAAEDRFGDRDPVRLGANLAVATLADVLAAGAEPRFMLQALALPPEVPGEFIDGLMQGLRSILDPAGCAILGGDLGTAPDGWRFTGFAMGPVPGNHALTRRLPPTPQTLWVSGPLGDANLAALQGRAAPAFEYRGPTAALIRAVGTACIDTSGGFADALWLLHQQSPGVGFRVDLDALPLAAGVAACARHAAVPPEAFLLGGAGEYELLFATPAELPDGVCEQLYSLGSTVVGQAGPALPAGSAWMRAGRVVGHLSAAPPCPRSVRSVEEHIGEVLRRARQDFGGDHV